MAAVPDGADLRDGGECTGGTGATVTYELSTNDETDMSLWVRYWGNETSCTRTFNILVDGEKVATESIANKWKKNEFVNVEYVLPNALVAGKKIITVKFETTTGMVGGLYGVRLLRRTASTGIVTRSSSLDGRPFVKLSLEKSVLLLDLTVASDVATVVHVRRLDGQIVKRRSIPAGTLRAKLDMNGTNGPFVVQIQRAGALIQASLVTNPK